MDLEKYLNINEDAKHIVEKEEIYNDIPTDNVQAGLAAFTGISLVGISIGSAIATYVFFGGVTLLGLVAVVESNPRLKRVVSSNTRVIDFVIFGGSVWALMVSGITVAAGLTFAGLGYTLVYSPYLRELRK